MQLVSAAQIETPELYTDLFNEFWLLYPRKEGKKECRGVWARIPESEHIAILEAVVAWRQVWKQQERSTHHIKMPREWLILERWTDEIPQELQTKSSHAPAQAAMGSSPSGPRSPIPPHVQEVLDRLKAKR